MTHCHTCGQHLAQFLQWQCSPCFCSTGTTQYWCLSNRTNHSQNYKVLHKDLPNNWDGEEPWVKVRKKIYIYQLKRAFKPRRHYSKTTNYCSCKLKVPMHLKNDHDLSITRWLCSTHTAVNFIWTISTVITIIAHVSQVNARPISTFKPKSRTRRWSWSGGR